MFLVPSALSPVENTMNRSFCYKLQGQLYALLSKISSFSVKCSNSKNLWAINTCFQQVFCVVFSCQLHRFHFATIELTLGYLGLRTRNAAISIRVTLLRSSLLHCSVLIKTFNMFQTLPCLFQTFSFPSTWSLKKGGMRLG